MIYFITLSFSVNDMVTFMILDQKFVMSNDFELVDRERVARTALWDNYPWFFAKSLNNYLEISESLSVRNISDSLKQDFIYFMRCFDYILLNGIKPEQMQFNGSDVPFILNPDHLNIDRHRSIHNMMEYQFLVSEHFDNMQNNNFIKMECEELVTYIEEKYYPAVFKVFDYLLDY